MEWFRRRKWYEKRRVKYKYLKIFTWVWDLRKLIQVTFHLCYDAAATITFRHYNEAAFSTAAPFCDLTSGDEGRGMEAKSDR